MAEYIRVSDYCKLSSHNKSKVYRAINSGVIKTKKIDGVKYVDVEQLPEEFQLHANIVNNVKNSNNEYSTDLAVATLPSKTEVTPFSSDVSSGFRQYELVQKLYFELEDRTKVTISTQEITIKTLSQELEKKNSQIENLLRIIENKYLECDELKANLKDSGFKNKVIERSSQITAMDSAIDSDFAFSIDPIIQKFSEEEIKDFQENLSKEEIFELYHVNKILKQKLQALGETLNEKEEIIQELESLAASNKDFISIEEHKLILNGMQNELGSQEEMLNILETELNEKQDEINEMELELTEKQAYITSMEEEHSKYQQNIAELEEVETVKQKRIYELENSLSDYPPRPLIDELMEKINTLETDIKAKEEIINNYESQMSEEEIQLLNFNKDKQELIDQLNTVKKDLEEKLSKEEDLKGEIRVYQEKVQNYEEHIEEDKTHIFQLTEELSKNRELVETVKENFKTSQFQLEKENNELKNRIEELTKQLIFQADFQQEAETSYTVTSIASEEIESLRTSQDNMLQDLQKKDQEIDKLKNELEKALDQLIHKDEELKTEREKLIKLDKAIKEEDKVSPEDIATFKATQDELTKLINRQSEDLKKSMEQFEELQNQLAAKEEELIIEKQKVIELSQHKTELENSMEIDTDNKEEISQEFATLQSSYIELSNQFNARAEEFNRLLQHYQELQTVLNEKEQELQNEKEKVEELTQTKADLINSIVTNSPAPAQSSEFINISPEGYQNIIKSLESKVQELESEIEKITGNAPDRGPDWFKKI